MSLPSKALPPPHEKNVFPKDFWYRIETIFTEVLLLNANPIGKIVYYALCT